MDLKRTRCFRFCSALAWMVAGVPFLAAYAQPAATGAGSRVSHPAAGADASRQTTPRRRPHGVRPVAHTAAAGAAGGLLTWGANDRGQLGDATQTDRGAPGMVIGLSAVKSVAIATGSTGFMLAVKPDGTLWGWGASDALGANTVGPQQPTPVQVAGISSVAAVTAGDNHAVAVEGNGTVWAWGQNVFGELGDGTSVSRNVPNQVQDPLDATGYLTGVIAVAASGNHTLALKSDGTVWGWGRNTSGVLGDGTVTDRASAVQVTGLTGVVAIATTTSVSLALKSDGTVWSWGSGFQLDGGNTFSRLAAAQIPGVSGVRAISAGSQHVLALENDGTVWGWGNGPTGALGPNFTDAPAAISGLTGATAVAAGNGFSAVLREDGTVWTFGQNNQGDLGRGNVGPFDATPALVPGLSGVCRISAGGTDMAVIQTATGTLAWGANSDGRLGDGTTTDRTDPTPVVGLTDITAVSAGRDHSLALRSDGTVSAWGENYSGQLGDGVSGNGTLVPAPVTVGGTQPLGGVTSIEAALSDSYAVRSDGTVCAWGDNAQGQLGNGAAGFGLQATPSPVLTPDFNPLTGVTATSAGLGFATALLADGTVRAWGQNFNGNLGDGTRAAKAFAVPVANLTDVTAISTGGLHALALKSDGTVWAWGDNRVGELGDGTFTSQSLPEQVLNLSHIIAISAGDTSSVALQSDGTLWTWGDNTNGELGDGTLVSRSVPAPVPGLSGVTAVAGKGFHYLALAADGTLSSWGWYSLGLHNVGPIPQQNTPVPVPGLSGVVGISAGYLDNLVIRASANLGPGPSISAVSNRITPQGTPIGPLPFTVGDPSVDPSLLTLSASSDTPFVVPAGNIVFGGSGTNRTVTITPAAGMTGTATITLTVNDGQQSASTSFSVLFVPGTVPAADSLLVVTRQDQPVDINPQPSNTNVIDTLPQNGQLQIPSFSGPATPITTVPYVLDHIGDIQYVPNAGFTGVDSFNYSALYNAGGTYYRSGPEATVSVHVGLAPPTLSGITVTSVTSTIASINWTADLPTASTVAYSTPGTAYDHSAFTSSTGTANSITLTGLTPGSLYHFQITANTAVSHQPGDPDTTTVSDDYTFTTLAAPTANPQAVTTPENTAVNVTLTGSSPDPRPLTFALVQGPQHGTLTGPDTASGVAQYTPGLNAIGADSFTFQVLDGDGTPSQPATVSITVTPVGPNHAPVATDQTRTLPSNVSTRLSKLPITLTATDADGNPLTYTITNTPGHGTLGPLVGASATYTPNLNFIGTDTIKFRASDGIAQSNQGTVTFTVFNRPPTSFPEQYSGLANSTLHVSAAQGVLANDVDPEQQTLHATVAVPPSNGTLTLALNGSFDYTPNADWVGRDSFTYTATDPHGATSQATVFLQITAVPVAADSSVSLLSNTATMPTSIPVTFQATDLDGDPLTCTIISGPSHGTLGALTGATAVYTPTVNFTGTDRIRFSVSDGTHTSNTAVVTITVVNRPPTAVADSYTTRANRQLAVNPPVGVLANDTDPEQRNLTVTLVSTTSHGTLTLYPNGKIFYTPNAAFTGTDTFTYQAVDPQGATSAPTLVTITVTP